MFRFFPGPIWRSLEMKPWDRLAQITDQGRAHLISFQNAPMTLESYKKNPCHPSDPWSQTSFLITSDDFREASEMGHVGSESAAFLD